jgi:hypothetical protein
MINKYTSILQKTKQTEIPSKEINLSRRKFLGLVGVTLAWPMIPCLFETSETHAQKINETSESHAQKVHEAIKSTPIKKEEYDAYFYTVSIMSGLGIAIDVAVATLAMYRQLDTVKKQTMWTAGVGLSHILLPIISGTLTAGLEGASNKTNYADILNRSLSAGGFGLIMKFLYDEINGADAENEDNTEESILNAKDISKYLAAIWAVSVDAAVSGPAKYKQASNQNWSLDKTMKSAAIGGLTVSLVAFSALKLANKLRDKFSDNTNVEDFLEKHDETILAIEAFILNYFGVDALLNGTFKTDTGFWGVNAASLFATGALYLPKLK